MGLVSQVFDESTLEALKGHIAIGHARYSTTGASTWQNAQPTFRPTADGSIALGHNGNLTNTRELARWSPSCPSDAGELDLARPRPRGRSTNDTDLVTALLARHPDTLARGSAPSSVLPKLEGAFSLVCMDEDTLYAARDPQGIRPLVLGRLERGWVVASETAALDIVGASFVREIEPGELIAIDEDGLRTPALRRAGAQGLPVRVRLPGPPGHPDRRPAASTASRVEIGRRLAREYPVDADLVIPVPESGTPAAIGYAEESGIPYGQGLVKNSYVGRTFIQPVADHPPARHPAQAQPAARRHRGQAAGRRRRLDRARQHPARAGADAARGRRPRGARADLQPAGEVAVLLRHRLRHPRRADRQRPVRRGDLRLDRRRLPRLHLPRELVEATTVPKDNLCRACFDGVYPVALPEPELLGKHLLEVELAGARPADVDGWPPRSPAAAPPTR